MNDSLPMCVACRERPGTCRRPYGGSDVWLCYTCVRSALSDSVTFIASEDRTRMVVRQDHRTGEVHIAADATNEELREALTLALKNHYNTRVGDGR